MGQYGDVWNALIKEMANPVGPCGICSIRSVFPMNRLLSQTIDSSIYDFIDSYYEKHDLSHLYALHQACNEIIEASANEIVFDCDTEEIFLEIVESELRYFEEIESILDINDLIHELWQVAQGEYWSDGFVNIPRNMNILGKLSFAIQKKIEGDQSEIFEKIHAYMCSLTIGNYKRFDYESFIYQLSRGIDCEETINNFIPYLQKDASNRDSLYSVRHWYEAEVLRLIQWAEIGNISEQVKRFCQSIKIAEPVPIGKNDDKVWNYLNTPFALFRSDFAVKYLNEKLTKYLLSCQVWIKKTLSQKNTKDNPLTHLAKMSISAVYLFGSYRLGISRFDKSTIETAASYLQTNQLDDTNFVGETFYFVNYLEINAMIVHALWISEEHGWKRSIQRIYNWIIGQIDVYGVWYHFRFDRTGYTTGLMLDTLELIEDGGEITFSVPSHKTSHLKSQNEESQDQETQDEELRDSTNKIAFINQIYHYSPTINQYITNIFGATQQDDKAKSSTDHISTSKPKSKTKSKKTKIAQNEYIKWENQKEAVIRIDYKDNIKTYFIYKDHDPVKLHIKEKERLYKLICIFCKDGDTSSSISASYIKKTFSDNADKVVASCNHTLNRKIRQTGVCDWDGDVEFFRRLERGSYECIIPIMTNEQYDNYYLENQQQETNDRHARWSRDRSVNNNRIYPE